MKEEVNLEISVRRNFGPPIGNAIMPEFLIDQLNNFVDDQIDKNSQLSKELDFGSNLAGQVKQEIKLPNDIIQPDLLSFLGNVSKHYIKLSCKKDISEFKIIDAWIVRQFENDYNPMHYHSGHLSGVGYIKLPDNFGVSPNKTKKDNPNGNISFQYGVKQFLANGHVSYKPKLGDFYIFPNYLYHSVHPFYGEGERRSVSFNAFIDDKIYNVYA